MLVLHLCQDCHLLLEPNLWCDVVWHVVWCGVPGCFYQMAMAGMVLHTEKCKPGGLCVSMRAVCSVCRSWEGEVRSP